MLNFFIDEKDRPTFNKIIDRAAELAGRPIDRTDLTMDLEATNSNGTPLDFDKLLAADDLNFAHDIYGIGRHLNRRTGKLKNHFLPRCSS